MDLRGEHVTPPNTESSSTSTIAILQRTIRCNNVKIGPYIVDIFYQPSTFHTWGGSIQGVGCWSPNAKLLTFLVGNFTTVLYVFFKEDFSNSLILNLPL